VRWGAFQPFKDRFPTFHCPSAHVIESTWTKRKKTTHKKKKMRKEQRECV
jgi:hypothetical protein